MQLAPGQLQADKLRGRVCNKSFGAVLLPLLLNHLSVIECTQGRDNFSQFLRPVDPFMGLASSSVHPGGSPPCELRVPEVDQLIRKSLRLVVL